MAGDATDMEKFLMQSGGHNPRAEFAFINHLITLGEGDEKYSHLSTYLKQCSNEIGALEISNTAAIVDFNESQAQCRVFRVSAEEEDRQFSVALGLLPNNVRTRVIILKDSKRGMFATYRTMNTLGSIYGVDPVFLQTMAQLSQFRVSAKEHRVTDYAPWERPLQPSFVELGYNTIPNKSEGPRLWVSLCEKANAEGLIAKVVIIRFTPSHLDLDDMTEESLILYRQLTSLPPTIPDTIPPLDPLERNSQLGYCLEILSSLKGEEITSSNKEPIAYIVPFLHLFQAYFSRCMHQLRKTHWEWLHHELGGSFTSQAERDNLIFETWNASRSFLEDFNSLTDQLRDYVAELNPGQGPTDPSASPIGKALAKHDRMIAQSRTLEQHVRDTIQLNVSSLALRESRKSIEQADSIGRITFLAFIFLPLSLVTSFFGMNIQELTGTGAPWLYFGVATAALCASVVMVCLWMWRRRWGWLAFVLYAPLMGPLALLQVLWALTLEFATSELVGNLWAGPLGEVVLDWWALGPYG